MDWIIYFTITCLCLGLSQEVAALRSTRQRRRWPPDSPVDSYQGDLSIGDIVCRTCCSRIGLSGSSVQVRGPVRYGTVRHGEPGAYAWIRIPHRSRA
jgi:hypothetical protein